jgi:hypothetical protein
VLVVGRDEREPESGHRKDNSEDGLGEDEVVQIDLEEYELALLIGTQAGGTYRKQMKKIPNNK